MADRIVRTVEEINDARERALAAEIKADEAGDMDDAASAVYQFAQWLFGYSDTDPTVEMMEDEE